MKALIIENERSIEYSVKAFLKDNPDLFEDVDDEMYCLDRQTEDLLPKILASDALIVSSTWLYKDQLNDYLDAFLNPKFPKKMKFYIHQFTWQVNDWQYNDSTFMREPELFQKIKGILAAGHTIYDFFEDPKTRAGSDVIDNLNISHELHSRGKYVAFEMKYSKREDMLYIPHEYYNLKSNIEEFKK